MRHFLYSGGGTPKFGAARLKKGVQGAVKSLGQFTLNLSMLLVTLINTAPFFKSYSDVTIWCSTFCPLSICVWHNFSAPTMAFDQSNRSEVYQIECIGIK